MRNLHQIVYIHRITRTNNPLEADGIIPTPDSAYVIFSNLNNGELYRLDPDCNPAAPETQTIGGVTPADIGNTDGLEFLDGSTFYSVDNSLRINDTPGSFEGSPERIVRLRLSDDYLTRGARREEERQVPHPDLGLEDPEAAC